MEKHKLNITRSSYERYYVIDGSMGGCGEPKDSPNHKYTIANGVDRGNGYQGYMSVTYALFQDVIPHEAIKNLKSFLILKGYKV